MPATSPKHAARRLVDRSPTTPRSRTSSTSSTSSSRSNGASETWTPAAPCRTGRPADASAGGSTRRPAVANVRWSDGALDDLHGIGEYFGRTSPQYARSVVARLYAAADDLADHPRIGRVVPEIGVEHVREVVREGYRVVDVESGDLVEVLPVLHGRQDLGRKLRRE